MAILGILLHLDNQLRKGNKPDSTKIEIDILPKIIDKWGTTPGDPQPIIDLFLSLAPNMSLLYNHKLSVHGEFDDFLSSVTSRELIESNKVFQHFLQDRHKAKKSFTVEDIRGFDQRGTHTSTCGSDKVIFLMRLACHPSEFLYTFGSFLPHCIFPKHKWVIHYAVLGYSETPNSTDSLFTLAEKAISAKKEDWYYTTLPN